MLTHASPRDPQALTDRSGSLSSGSHYSFLVGPDGHKLLFFLFVFVFVPPRVSGGYEV